MLWTICFNQQINKTRHWNIFKDAHIWERHKTMSLLKQKLMITLNLLSVVAIVSNYICIMMINESSIQKVLSRVLTSISATLKDYFSNPFKQSLFILFTSICDIYVYALFSIYFYVDLVICDYLYYYILQKKILLFNLQNIWDNPNTSSVVKFWNQSGLPVKSSLQCRW